MIEEPDQMEEDVEVDLSEESSGSQGEEDETQEAETSQKRGRVPRRYKTGEIKKNSVDNSCVVARWLLSRYEEHTGSYQFKQGVWQAYRADVQDLNTEQHAHTARFGYFTSVMQTVFPNIHFSKRKPHHDFKEPVDLIMNLRKRDVIKLDSLGWEEVRLCHESASLNGWSPTNTIWQSETESGETVWREWSLVSKKVSVSGEPHTRRILVDSRLQWQLWIHNYKMTLFNLGCPQITTDLELELLMAIAKYLPLCQGFKVARDVQSQDATGLVVGTTELWHFVGSRRGVEFMHRSEECRLVLPLASICHNSICSACSELSQRFERDTQDLIIDKTTKSKRVGGCKKEAHESDEIEIVILHKRYRCLLCNYSTNRANHFKMHESTHSEDRPFACDKCDHRAKTLVLLKNHQQRHLDEKPLQCTECDFTTKHYNSLHMHMKIHAAERPHQCSLCDFATKHASSLKCHMLLHADEKPFQCGLCPFASRHRMSLTLHLRTHTKERPYKCDKCDFSASCSSNLRQHEQTHTNKRKYQCTICNRYFRSQPTLKNHTLTHTDLKPHACDVCGQSFRQNSNLQRHMLTHTGEKKFSCSQCDLKFTIAANMQRHVKVAHTDEPKEVHKCEQCGKSLSSINGLQRHVATVHQGLKAYCCSICKKSYTSGTNLRKHMETHASSSKTSSGKSQKGRTPANQKTRKSNRHKKVKKAGDSNAGSDDDDDDAGESRCSVKRKKICNDDDKLQVEVSKWNSLQDSDVDKCRVKGVSGMSSRDGSQDPVGLALRGGCHVVIERIKEIDQLVKQELSSYEMDDPTDSSDCELGGSVPVQPTNKLQVYMMSSDGDPGVCAPSSDCENLAQISDCEPKVCSQSADGAPMESAQIPDCQPRDSELEEGAQLPTSQPQVCVISSDGDRQVCAPSSDCESHAQISNCEPKVCSQSADGAPMESAQSPECEAMGSAHIPDCEPGDSTQSSDGELEIDLQSSDCEPEQGAHRSTSHPDVCVHSSYCESIGSSHNSDNDPKVCAQNSDSVPKGCLQSPDCEPGERAQISAREPELLDCELEGAVRSSECEPGGGAQNSEPVMVFQKSESELKENEISFNVEPERHESFDQLSPSEVPSCETIRYRAVIDLPGDLEDSTMNMEATPAVNLIDH